MSDNFMERPIEEIPTPRYVLSEEHEAQLVVAEEKARTDQMTGLLNKEALQAETAERIELAKQGKARPAFFLFDADNFKQVNDRFGHAAGDQLITAMGEMLEEALRSKDRVLVDKAGRFGGDEFGALIDLIPEKDTELSPWDVLKLIETRIEEGIKGLFEKPEFAHLKEYAVGVSFGGSVWQSGMEADDLINQADKEMYRKKEAKKSADNSPS